MFSAEQRKMLLQLARDAIKSQLTEKQVTLPEDRFLIKRGVFVSLHKHGQLRGCIGYTHGFKEIIPSIIEMAQAAAFKDPRFEPVTLEELSELEIEISVLSEMELITDAAEIVIGRDGLGLIHPWGSGILLPQVPVEHKWDVSTYLKQICYKAGLPPDSWKEKEAKLYRFTAEVFSESTEFSD